MIPGDPLAQLFRVGALEGLRLIRLYWRKQPALAIEEVISLIEKVDQSGRSLDLEAASALHFVVPQDCVLEGPHFYQTCIRELIVLHRPIWIRLMKQGRSRFLRGLHQDDADVFRLSGLRADLPDSQVTAWWDELATFARMTDDVGKVLQGRDAERLTLELEADRLAKMGLDVVPEWVGLDDNFAGYDVLSYDMVDGEPQRILIEVKSTTVSPIKFTLTRNEWDKAEKFGDAYKFHIWNMAQTPPILHCRTFNQVKENIPQDRSKGKWRSVEMPIGGDG